jgi:hypothetical protein
MRKAAEGLPYDLGQTVDLPLDIATAGVTGTFALGVRVWEGVPEGWTLTLVDTQGTPDPSDDATHPLASDGAPYTFTVTGETAGVWRAPSGQASAGGAGAGKAGAGRTALTTPRVEPLAARLTRTAPGFAEAAKASGTGAAPRFLLRVRPGTPIPVELAALTATTDKQVVTLAWQTQSETNNAGFAVERRTPGGEAWTEVAFVAGAGTTAEPQSYRHEVVNVRYGTHAFRLRQIDLDGTTTVAGEVEVRVELDEPYALAAYPNPVPASTSATIDVTAREAQHVRVVVYDVLGRRVATLFEGEVEASQTERLRMPVRGLASGLYFVRVVGDHFVGTRRITLVR